MYPSVLAQQSQFKQILPSPFRDNSSGSPHCSQSQFWKLLTASLPQHFQPRGLLLPMVSLHPVQTVEIIPSWVSPWQAPFCLSGALMDRTAIIYLFIGSRTPLGETALTKAPLPINHVLHGVSLLPTSATAEWTKRSHWTECPITVRQLPTSPTEELRQSGSSLRHGGLRDRDNRATAVITNLHKSWGRLLVEIFRIVCKGMLGGSYEQNERK